MSHETIGPQNQSELLIGSESLADFDLLTRRARPGQMVLSISPPLPSPEEERLTLVDDNYLQHFLTKHRVHSEIHVSHRHASILMAPRGLSYLKSSKPLRYAALALASHSKNGPQSIETDRYMTLSYTYIIEAISNSAFADVVYASGIIVELSVLRDEPVSKVLSHLMGMRHSLEEIKFDPSTKDLSEFLWMERSWNTVLRIFYTRLYKRCHHQSSKFVELVESICGVLESSQFILTSNLQAPDGGGRDLVLRERINTLETYVGYCFVRYLLRINDILGDNPQRRATDLLRRVLRQIIDITPCPCLGVNLYIDEIRQLSHYNFTTYPYLRGGSESSWESRYQMSWYFTSMLIDATFSPTSDNSKAVATSAAISLCWLSVLHEINYWVEFRNILLAGLILTRSRYPRGTSPIQANKKTHGSNNDWDNWLFTLMGSKIRRHLGRLKLSQRRFWIKLIGARRSMIYGH
jgi:hypothetical protein